MTCNCHPQSPFLWRKNPRPSIFMADHVFRSKGQDGLSASQIASNFVEKERKRGKLPGSIINLGKTTKQKELALIAYKQFGIYSRAVAVKPQLNKHQLPKGKA